MAYEQFTNTSQGGPTRARSNGRVAPSNSTLSSKERATARRWTVTETQAIVASAPAFAYEAPSGERVDELAAEYRAITEQWLRSPKQRNLLAAAYRVHGPHLLDVVRATFADRHSTVNLLGIVRATPPPRIESASPLPGISVELEPGPEPLDHDGIPCPVDQCLRGVVFCQAHFPKFDPTSTIRYDRRSWPGYASQAAEGSTK